MAAVAAQAVLAGAQRLEQVEAGNAAARAAARAIGVERDQDSGPVVTLGDPRGNDPDDPGVPAGAGEHQPGGIAEPIGQLGAGGLGGGQHVALYLAAFVVGAIQLGRDLRRACLVGGQHQLDPGVGAVQAAGGVDPRTEPEADVALVESLGDDPRRGHQRAQPRSPRLAGHPEAAAHQGAVLASQRDEVGDCCQSNEVEVGLGRRRSEQRRAELVGDPGGAQLGEGIAIEGRVQDRAVGQSVAGQMVIRDDHVDAGRPRRGDFVDRADPAVCGDQQPGAALGQPLHGRHRHSVAVLLAPGDQPVAVTAQLADGADRDRGRADAVDVVVPVNGHMQPGGDGGANPFADGRHRPEQQRIVTLVRVEERARLLERAVAAPDQGHRHRLGEPEPVHQVARLAVVVRLERERPGGGFLHAARLSSAWDGIPGRGRTQSAQKLDRFAPLGGLDQRGLFCADAEPVHDGDPDQRPRDRE